VPRRTRSSISFSGSKSRAQRDYETYAEKKNELVTGIVQRIEKNDVYVNIGKTDALMNPGQSDANEHYFNAMRMKVYITTSSRRIRGRRYTSSRSHPGLIRRYLN
jgi:N utilization substance protein A